ncbi:MAG: glycogen debranching N-terminal domain-containing protein [Acetobacteraceae bacterium]|nr:glycogen debranching N-terminal domain-containing protein [Acetobacteraceae bacterium]
MCATSIRDPATIRSTGKVLPSTTRLRDVNRCTVRPDDLIAHQGYSVLVTDVQGWIGKGLEGVYLHQTRFLSRFHLRVEETQISCVSANVADHHCITSYHLAPSPAARAAEPPGEHKGPSGSEVVRKAIKIQVNGYCGSGLHVDLTVTNHGLAAADLALVVELDADFADFNEALAGNRKQKGLVERHWCPGGEGGTLRFDYLHPELDLSSRCVLAGAPVVHDLGDGLACPLHLAPQEARRLTLALHPHFLGTDYAPFYGPGGAFDPGASPAVKRREWEAGCQTIEAANPAVQAAWEQAVSDLVSLQILEGEGAAPYMVVAGMPNFTGLFGRDAYVAALQSAVLSPLTMRGALDVITPFNATETNDAIDAEPGKVLHQRQLGPLAQLKISPFLRYYGDQSTPGLFLLAAATEFANTGDAEFFRSLRERLDGTLAWMRHNEDERGFYPYQRRSPKGVKNQSWKDSGEAVLTHEGAMVPDPIAMADVQALYYAGKQALGLAMIAIGDERTGQTLLAEAAALKRRFNDSYWMPDEQFYAIALDPEGKQVRSVASDPGSCLAYGIIDDSRTTVVADRIMSEELFSGWGIRTLSAKHPAYNPFGYHLGTVWPSPNAVAGFGLRRYGFDEHFFRLAAGLFAASQIFDLDRLPEVFGGHPRDATHPHPGLYPGACSPQAWSASAIILLVNTFMGLMPVAPRRALVADPALPEWLPELTVRNVRVGDRRVALRARRGACGTELDVLETDGVSVVRPGDMPPGRDRVVAALKSIL